MEGIKTIYDVKTEDKGMETIYDLARNAVTTGRCQQRVPGSRNGRDVHFPQVAGPGHLGLYPVSDQRKEVTRMTDEQWGRYIELVLKKGDLMMDAMQAKLKEPPAGLKEVDEELAKLRPLAIEETLKTSKDEELCKIARDFLKETRK